MELSASFILFEDALNYKNFNILLQSAADNCPSAVFLSPYEAYTISDTENAAIILMNPADPIGEKHKGLSDLLKNEMSDIRVGMEPIGFRTEKTATYTVTRKRKSTTSQ